MEAVETHTHTETSQGLRVQLLSTEIRRYACGASGNTAQGHTPMTLSSTAKTYKLVSVFPVLSYTCNTICESSQDLHYCSFVHLISSTSGIRLTLKKEEG